MLPPSALPYSRTGNPHRTTPAGHPTVRHCGLQHSEVRSAGQGYAGEVCTLFREKGIDLCTQQTFHRDFCLATRHSEDGQRRTCLAFPMTLPEDADKIVGFEKRGYAYTDGNSSYDDMTEGNHSGKVYGLPVLPGQLFRKPSISTGSRVPARQWYTTSFIGRKTKSYERRSSSQRAANLPRNRCEACLSLRSLVGSISVSTPVGRVEVCPNPAKGNLPHDTLHHRGDTGAETISRFHTGRQ